MKNKNIEKDMEDSSIRNMSTTILNFLKERIPEYWIGQYYQLLHNIIIFGGSCVILFNTNVYHLIVLLIVISLDAFANVVCHDCPLTNLEKQYLKSSLSHDRRKTFKNLNIMYKCNHIYESQVELIVNMWSLVAAKIVIIIALRTFTPAYLSVIINQT